MGHPFILQKMERKMDKEFIKVKGYDVLTPISPDISENIRALRENRRSMSLHKFHNGVTEDSYLSMFDRNEINSLLPEQLINSDRYTFFEALCIACASRALERAHLKGDEDDTLFILSTTKGNVECLEQDIHDDKYYPSASAQKICDYFGNSNPPIVVSNACISGVCAQIAGVRFLKSHRYKCALILGVDVLSEFIISGFQSFKALSDEPCKPYDKSRKGLNLGEATAAMVLERCDNIDTPAWVYQSSSNHNDANHISGPSRTGEGAYKVLQDIMKNTSVEDLALINAHGTATLYNDEMESIAIERAGLSSVPINGMKGCYGHTLGAAGILETILTMEALSSGMILPTVGYENQGTSRTLNISNKVRCTDKKTFIKLLSGFGGTNAGISYSLIIP